MTTKKQQTRRSVSLNGLTHQRVQAHCMANNISVAGFVDVVLHRALHMLGQPVETVLKPRPNAKPKPLPEAPASGVFSW